MGLLRIPIPKAGWEAVVERDLHLATPALIGGAGTGAGASAEARLTSLLGMLRFWWRATSALPDAELRTREIHLFGGPAVKTSKQGTGCFTAALTQTPASSTLDRKEFPKDIKDRALGRKVPQSDITAYLGPGVTLNRDHCLSPGHFGKITLRFSARASAVDREEVLRALDALCLFGGVGLLSRRGMGSLMMHAGDQKAPTFPELSARLRRFVAQLPLDAKPSLIPRFSNKAAVILIATKKHTGIKALNLQAVEADDFSKTCAPLNSASVFAGQSSGRGDRLPSTLFVHVHMCSHAQGAANHISSALVLTHLPVSLSLNPLASDADRRVGSFLAQIAGGPEREHIERIVWSAGE